MGITIQILGRAIRPHFLGDYDSPRSVKLSRSPTRWERAIFVFPRSVCLKGTPKRQWVYHHFPHEIAAKPWGSTSHWCHRNGFKANTVDVNSGDCPWFFFYSSQKTEMLLKIAIYSEFSHQKWWFPIVMLNYQRVYLYLYLTVDDLNVEFHWKNPHMMVLFT